MAQKNKRREADVMKLMMSEYRLELVDDRIDEFYIWFSGPKDSPYEGGVWRVHVELPDAYPYKSPSIGFVDRIYHPNVDETAGSVCLDVINQTWSPMFDLINVFEVFLPQLLLYPNPTDPLNGEAAALLMREPEAYNKKVREYVQKYGQCKLTQENAELSSDNNSTDSVGDQENEQTDTGEELGETQRDTENNNALSNNSDPMQVTETIPNEKQTNEAEDMVVDQQEAEDGQKSHIGDNEDAFSEGSFLSNSSDEDDQDQL